MPSVSRLKPVWAEGVFLAQQHFQAWDRYLEDALATRWKLAGTQAWGFISLDVMTDALDSGRFVVTACEALFPHGGLVRLENDISDPVSVDISSLSAPTSIYLVFPANSRVRGVPGYDDSERECAWSAEHLHLQDSLDPGREREVMLARPNLSLLIGDPGSDPTAALRIADVRPDGDGRFSLVPGTIPPLCRLDGSAEMLRWLARFRSLLAAKVSVLIERRGRLGNVADFGSADLASFLLLQVLRPTLSMLEHFEAHPNASPTELYKESLRLIAGLQGFHGADGIRVAPRYRHDDLGGTFEEVEALARELLKETGVSREVSVRLVRDRDSMFVAQGLSASLMARYKLFLTVSYDHPDPAWVTDFARKVKVGAPDDIDLIIGSALTGVAITHVQRPPSRLALRSGAQCFTLERHGDFWQRARDCGSLAVFLPPGYGDVDVDLAVLEAS